MELVGASLRFGERPVWSGLELQVAPGEFLAVLGPNGAGKTSLLRVLLGLTRLSAGTVWVAGKQPRRGSPAVGYIPQQRPFDRALALRGRDLVALGLDGHRFGLGRRDRSAQLRVNRAISAVGAAGFADAPVGLLSGGEQQRLRIAQALLSDPPVLLCDEPLLSLDLRQQGAVTDLIDAHRRRREAAVLFVTHDINPVLPMVDRVLVVARGRAAVGPPERILTSDTLSELYGVPVDVLQVRDRVVVVTGPEEQKCS